MLENYLSGKIKLEILHIPFVDTNCYVLINENDCILIDAGGDGKLIIDYFKNNNLSLKAIFLTHGHYDHIEALDNLYKEYNDVMMYANEEEKVVIENNTNSLMDHNLSDDVLKHITYIKDGTEFNILNLKIKMIATPGHTIGCCCYYVEDLKILFSGDTLFRGTYGRVDLPTSNAKDIVLSISKKLMQLPDDVVAFPGHGASTTIAYEREHSELMQDYVINWAINN